MLIDPFDKNNIHENYLYQFIHTYEVVNKL